jgi:hypothetical protein
MDFQPEPLPPDLQAKLTEALPPEAITSNDKHSHLSSIKPAFVIERMNQVFGVGGYVERYREISMTTKEVVYKQGTPQERKVTLFVATVHGTLDIPKYGIHLENYGGSENENAGDELKGACTDAFTKMCSHLGIGLDVYKGTYDKPKESNTPECPVCGKHLFVSKKEDDPGYYCWTKKQGCGAKFTEEGLKAAQASKNGSAKPPQSAQSPRQAQAAPLASDVAKITIHGKVMDRITDNGKLWLKVGDRRCVTMQEDIKLKLKTAWRGAEVELLVSELTGKTETIYQIHKVINVKAGGTQ